MPYKVLELSAILDLLIDTKFTKQNVRVQGYSCPIFLFSAFLEESFGVECSPD